MSGFDDDLRRSFMLEGYETSPYEKWVAEQGVPVVRGYSVYDLHSVEVAPWDWLGGLGSFVHLHGAGGTNDAWVVGNEVSDRQQAQFEPAGFTLQRHRFHGDAVRCIGELGNDPAAPAERA